MAISVRILIPCKHPKSVERCLDVVSTLKHVDTTLSHGYHGHAHIAEWTHGHVGTCTETHGNVDLEEWTRGHVLTCTHQESDSRTFTDMFGHVYIVK